MAILPVKCDKCGNTVQADPEKNGMKCPSCGKWLSLVRVLPKQHPKWVELVAEEKKLNDEYHRLENYADNYESSGLKTKKIFRGYGLLMVFLALDVIIFFFSVLSNGFRAPESTFEILMYVFMTIVTLAASMMPTMKKVIDKRNDEKNGANYAIENMPKTADKMAAIRQEKEAYLKEIERNGSA